MTILLANGNVQPNWPGEGNCSHWCKWQIKGSLASCMDGSGVPTCDQVSLHLCVCFPLTAYPFRRPNRKRATLPSPYPIPMAEVLGVSPVYPSMITFFLWTNHCGQEWNIMIGQAWVMCLLIGWAVGAMETCSFATRWREEGLWADLG